MNEKLTMKSSLREVYAHPVGHDILKKIMLQTGMQERLLDNRRHVSAGGGGFGEKNTG